MFSNDSDSGNFVLFLSPERETCQKFPSSFTRFVTRTLVRGLRRLEALTLHARGVSFFSSRDCAPLRVERGRVTEKTGNVNSVVRDRSNIGFARTTSKRPPSLGQRSLVGTEILCVLEKKQTAERARTRTCVGLGGILVDAGTPLFLDVCLCVSRSRGSYRRRG